MLKFLKVWQGEQPFLVWQVSPMATLRDQGPMPKKFYMTLGHESYSVPVYFSLAKPGALKAQGGGVAGFLRKHLQESTFVIHNHLGFVWILFGKSLSWSVRVPVTPPWEVEVVSWSTQESALRMSQRGIYTVRKPISSARLPALEEILCSPLYPLVVQGFGEQQQEVQKEGAEVGGVDVGVSVISYYQKEATKRMARRLKTMRQTIAKLEVHLVKASEKELLSEKAHLLRAYSYLVKPQDHVCMLDETLTGRDQPLCIELDPELSVGQNIDHYFIMLKKAKRSEVLQKQQWDKVHDIILHLEASLARMRTHPMGDVQVIQELERYQLNPAIQAHHVRTGEAAGEPFFKFLGTQTGVCFLVGKSSKESDQMIKQARSDDMWFHVVDGVGSHVLVPAKPLGGQLLSEESCKQAAMLALHYSKQRQNYRGEVYKSTRGVLKKKKGMPPGLWLIGSSQAVYVQYTEEELRETLSRPAKSSGP